MLGDSIAALGLLIAFYYATTGYACAWQFRHELASSPRALLVKGVLPLVGAVILTACFLKSARDMAASDYGNTSFHGVGGVYLLGIGALVLGVLVMAVCEASDCTFFRGARVDVPAPRTVLDRTGPVPTATTTTTPSAAVPNDLTTR